LEKEEIIGQGLSVRLYHRLFVCLLAWTIHKVIYLFIYLFISTDGDESS